MAGCKQLSDERRGIAEFCHKLVGEPLHVTAEPCCYHDLVCVVRAVRFLDNLCQELPLGCLWQAVKYTTLALDSFQAADWFSFLLDRKSVVEGRRWYVRVDRCGVRASQKK